MKERLLAVVLGLSIGLLVSCGKKDEADDDAAGKGGSAGSGAGTGATGGGAGMTGASGRGAAGMSGAAGTGPPITSAPAAWSRPAECGGIGDRCADILGCGTLSTCQLEGYVCIPKLEPGATTLPPRSAETPYCAAFTCMTFEQASCFCTGDAGELYSGCSSPSALAGLCVGEDASCESKACCDGLSCVDAPGGKRCLTPCSAADDCETGCCTDPYDIGVQVCAELDACTNPCKKEGEACTQGTSTTPNDCCRGSCVESERPEFAGCRPDCTTGEQCETGCCVPFSNSTNGFCADAKFCTCVGVEQSCAESPCCDGTLCLGATLEEATCFPLCTTTADCTLGECTPVPDSTEMICWDGTCTLEGGTCGGPMDHKCCSADGLLCVEGSCMLPCESDADCPGRTCYKVDETTSVCVPPP